MEDEYKAHELADKATLCGAYEASHTDVRNACMEMAKWKDEQSKGINCGKVLQLRRKAYKKGYDKAIEKACEWLKSKSCCGYIEDIEADELIAQFKKAMEE